MAEPRGRVLALHLGLIAVLFAAQFVLGEYHHTNVARIMVLAAYAVGYNLLLGYTGLMSLGHAMFFAAGMYGAGLAIYHLGFGARSWDSAWRCSGCASWRAWTSRARRWGGSWSRSARTRSAPACPATTRMPANGGSAWLPSAGPEPERQSRPFA